MDSLKTKIIVWYRRAKNAWPFFSFLKPGKQSQEEIDRKLVYNLAPRKIPNRDQMKHLNKFLNPREFLVIKICLLVILVNAVYLGISFIKKHLTYLPVSGGSYNEGLVGYPKTINPLYAVNRDVDSDLSSLIYSSLVKYDENGSLVNDLADQIDISANGKEYLVKVKSNILWHNGEKLTIDDILFTFDLIKNADYRSPLRSSLSIAEAERVDDNSIKFVLSEPYAPFLELLTFGVLPKSLWNEVSPSAAILSDLNLKPIGSGPYKFRSLIKSKMGDLKEYHLVVNEDYYGNKPYIKNLNFDFFADRQEALRALNDKQIDGLSYLPWESRKDVLAQNSLHFYELDQPQLVALFFNQEKNKALSEKIVRVALAKALDKRQLISEVFNNIYPLADSPLLATSPAYNNGVTRYDYDPVVAAETLRNKKLAVTLSVVDAGSNGIVADKIKKYWEAVGVSVTIKTVSSEQAANLVKNRDFDILLYGESIGGDPDVYAFWHSSQIGTKGLNLAGYNNSEVDKLLLEARVATTSNERIAKYQKFQEIVTTDLPAIFLYSPTYTYLQSKSVKGFASTIIIEPADRFSGVANWYIKTNKKLTW